jgi:hypothetical protein
VYKHFLGTAQSTTKHAQHNLMAFLKFFSAVKPATATTVAQALEPTVAAVHPKEDVPEALKGAQVLTSTPSELSLDERNPFSDPKVAEFYKDLYESCQYECRGAFDPELEWTPAEERRIVRKLDFRVCAFACFAFFALQCDRGNLSQAVSDNLLNDLNLTTDNYNTGMSEQPFMLQAFADVSRQHDVQSGVPASRDSVATDIQEAWSGSLDS